MKCILEAEFSVSFLQSSEYPSGITLLYWF